MRDYSEKGRERACLSQNLWEATRKGDSAHGDPRCSLDKSNQINPRKMNEIVNQNGEGKEGEDRLFPAGFALPEVKTAPDLDRNRRAPWSALKSLLNRN